MDQAIKPRGVVILSYGGMVGLLQRFELENPKGLFYSNPTPGTKPNLIHLLTMEQRRVEI